MPNNPAPAPQNLAADRIALLAKAGLICPFLVVLLALLAGRLDQPVRVVVEAGAMMLALVGLLCGLAALTQGRRSGGPAVAIQGGVGFLIGLVFVGIVLNDYLQHREQARTGQSLSPPADVAGMSPAARRLSEALASFVAKTTGLEQRLAAAAQPLGESPVLDLADVKSAATLDSRRRLVETFLEASHALSNHLAHSQAFLETQLTERGMPAADARETAADFLKHLENQFAVSRQIRELEHHYCQTLIEALELLSRQWGNWTPPTEGNPRFTDDAHTRQYSSLLQRLDELEKRDFELKQKLSNQ